MESWPWNCAICRCHSRSVSDRPVKILAAVDDASSRLAGSLSGWKVACLDIAGDCYRPLSPESASIELVAAYPSSSSSPRIANVLEVLREIT